MISYNSKDLIVGYIKELLHEFNLPKYKVLPKDTSQYEVGCKYIDGLSLVKCIAANKIEKVGEYTYNKNIINVTDSYIINASGYDFDTHRSLGEYLRFNRDYLGINLMPLYNCFSNKISNNLDFTVNGSRIYSQDNNYKVYISPVKFDQVYTIGINSPMPYEIMLIEYTGGVNTTFSLDLANKTYKKVNGSYLTDPYIYSTSVSDVSDKYKHEKDLMLVIKMPSTINSIITILEGDFRHCKSQCGRVVSTMHIDDKTDDPYTKVPTRLSLLEYNDGHSHPFADKLVEYLLKLAIDKSTDIENNVYRIQMELYNGRLFIGSRDIFDSHLGIALYKKLLQDSNRLRITRDVEGGSLIRSYYRAIDSYPDFTLYIDSDAETIIQPSEE